MTKGELMDEQVLDGRIVSEEAYILIYKLNSELDTFEKMFADGEAYKAFCEKLKTAMTWTKQCRKKQWLRTKEGMAMIKKVYEDVQILQQAVTAGTAEQAINAADAAIQSSSDLAKTLAFRTTIVT